MQIIQFIMIDNPILIQYSLLVAPLEFSSKHICSQNGLKPMKMVFAIIRPHRLQDVKEALADIGVVGLTVTDVRGAGRQKGQVERYRGSEYSIDLLAKIKLEVAVLDDQCEEVIQAIRKAAFTGEIGDGKIFVLPLEDSIRVRTGERGEDSL